MKNTLSDESMKRIAKGISKKAQEGEWGENLGPYYVLFGLEHNGGRWEVLYEDFDLDLVKDEEEEYSNSGMEEVRIKTFSTKDDAQIEKYQSRINHEEKQYVGR